MHRCLIRTRTFRRERPNFIFTSTRTEIKTFPATSQDFYDRTNFEIKPFCRPGRNLECRLNLLKFRYTPHNSEGQLHVRTQDPLDTV